MGRGNASQLTFTQRLGHEAELRAHHHHRSAPYANALLLGQIEQLLPPSQIIGHGLLAPDVFARLQGLLVQPIVFLHVSQIDEQVERCTGQHLVDMGIVIGYVVPLGRLFASLGYDVTCADQLDERAALQMRQILCRHTTAADYAHLGLLARRLCSRRLPDG